jgi:hypothetical protein
MQLIAIARTRPIDVVPPPVEAIVIEPDALVIVIFEPAVNVVRVNPVPLPMSKAPFAGVDVSPVPPFAIGKVPVTPAVNDVAAKLSVPLPLVCNV